MCLNQDTSVFSLRIKISIIIAEIPQFSDTIFFDMNVDNS